MLRPVWCSLFSSVISRFYRITWTLSEPLLLFLFIYYATRLFQNKYASVPFSALLLGPILSRIPTFLTLCFSFLFFFAVNFVELSPPPSHLALDTFVTLSRIIEHHAAFLSHHARITELLTRSTNRHDISQNACYFVKEMLVSFPDNRLTKALCPRQTSFTWMQDILEKGYRAGKRPILGSCS